MHLRLVVNEVRQRAGEAGRLAGQIEPDEVVSRGRRRALREDHRDHVEHRAQPLATVGTGRHLEPGGGGGQGLLRSRDAGLDRGRRHEERPGDLVTREPADDAQRQRDPCLGRQHRVAGDEDQREDVVVDAIRLPRLAARRRRCSRRDGTLGEVVGDRGVALIERRAAPQGIDRAPPGGGHQPPRRARGDTVAGPVDERLGKRLLGGILGEREVAGGTGERTDDPRRLDPPHRADDLARIGHSCPVASRHARSFWTHGLSWGNSSMLLTRRISVFIPGPASGARLAHSTASWMDATSRM